MTQADENILIVDDQQEILNSLQRLLKNEFNIFVAPSGEQGLELIRKQSFAVVVSDQRMPQMDGVTFLKQVKELQPEAIRILLTAYADIEATISAVNQAKIFQYISKPFEPDEFKQILNNALQHYRLVQENKRLQLELAEANKRLTSENIILKQQVPYCF